METTMLKESRLNIRCDSHTRQLLDKAASYAHVSISEFVLSNALASAGRVVREHESIAITQACLYIHRPSNIYCA